MEHLGVLCVLFRLRNHHTLDVLGPVFCFERYNALCFTLHKTSSLNVHLFKKPILNIPSLLLYFQRAGYQVAKWSDHFTTRADKHKLTCVRTIPMISIEAFATMFPTWQLS